MWGARYEYYKLCLEDTTACGLLCDVAEHIARAKIPYLIAAAMRISSLTALNKPDNKVRGIAAGDALRRLVSKALAKQFQDVARNGGTL